MKVTVCVPVLRRYDMLGELLRSLEYSTVRPDLVQIIDNGRRMVNQVRNLPVAVHTPEVPLGVAESWNWFINNVPEERVISNDDILFAPESLSLLLASKADLVWAKDAGFSCFVIRDSCVAKLGLFDEAISPGYGYYEDEDYLQRLDGRGTRAPSAVAEDVDSGVVHCRSSTLAKATPGELKEHHRRFRIAQRNYAKKWNVTF